VKHSVLTVAKANKRQHLVRFAVGWIMMQILEYGGVWGEKYMERKIVMVLVVANQAVCSCSSGSAAVGDGRVW